MKGNGFLSENCGEAGGRVLGDEMQVNDTVMLKIQYHQLAHGLTCIKVRSIRTHRFEHVRRAQTTRSYSCA